MTPDDLARLRADLAETVQQVQRLDCIVRRLYEQGLIPTSVVEISHVEADLRQVEREINQWLSAQPGVRPHCRYVPKRLLDRLSMLDARMRQLEKR